MWDSEEYLERIVKVLNDPFTVRMSLNAYSMLEEIAHKQGRFYPLGLLHKALGLTYSRIDRGTVEIEVDREIKECDIRTEDGEYSVLIAGMEVALPLGLKSIAHAVKKGLQLEKALKDKICRIQTKSYINTLALVSLSKALVQTGQDTHDLFYRRIVDSIGDPNSTVKLKAINAALAIGENSGKLIANTLAALKKDSLNAYPNPVWSPGMLSLVGIHIYKTKDKNACKSAIKIVNRYVGKISNEKVLNGVLVILWGMTSCGYKKHLPFLVLISLFARYPDIKRSASGLLVEYLGHNPSEESLAIMDSIRSRTPDIKAILLFGRVSRSLIIRYSNILVSEGTPLLIKRAAQLKMYAGEREYAYDPADIFSKICAFRIFLKTRNIPRLEELVSQTDATKLSTNVKIEMCLLEQVVKSVRIIGLSLQNSRKALLYALGKNVFPVRTIRALYTHRNTAVINIKAAVKTPSTLLALALLKDPAVKDIKKTQMECPEILLHKHSSAYPGCIYLLAVGKIISDETAKSVLFSLLECYDTDPVLGDVGSYIRADALFLLVCRYTEPTITSSLPPCIKRELPMGIVVTLLTKKRIRLTKEEKKVLVGYILKLAADKSRRIALLIFTSILPSIKGLPSILKYLLDGYNKAVDYLPVEDAIVSGCTETLKYILQKRRRILQRKKHLNGAYPDIKISLTEKTTQIKLIVEGVINTFASSDGSLTRKVIDYSEGVFKSRIVRKAANKQIKFLEASASRNSLHLINEIKRKILI